MPKKKVSEIIADFLVSKGVTHVFTVTGGGAMHLNDALGHNENLHCIYNHHEQASAIAAEGYARVFGRIAAVCVTSGPGGTNAITGVLGGWLDSIPMFVISGQVKRETTVRAPGAPAGLRQLGDQEFDITESVKTMTKYAEMVWDPRKVFYHLEKAWYLANSGRKGPVWLDIPLDIQGAFLDLDEEFTHFDPASEGYESIENPQFDKGLANLILEKIRGSKRPLIFAGTAIDTANARREFLELAEALSLPVVTAWDAQDVLPSDSVLDAGRPGTVGNRGGNFAVQTCDLLLVLGSRLNIRIISYNYKDFARDAYKIIVDIDEKELEKPTVKPDLAINANVTQVISALHERVRGEMLGGKKVKDILGDKSEWLKTCHELNLEYPACLKSYYESDYPLSHYAFTERLFKDYLNEGDTVVCGNGAACVVTFQACFVKRGMRIFTNSGCAAMGYGFPAAIGAAAAHASGSGRTVCIDGDGSFQMNIQELQTVVHNNIDLKIIIINNEGYHSIRQTQSNLFKDRPLVGVSADNGVSFPDLSKLIPAYGIPFFKITRLSDMPRVLPGFFAEKGPAVLETVVDIRQNFEPKLSSKVLPDGSIVSPPLDDMYPFLPREEYDSIKERLKGSDNHII